MSENKFIKLLKEIKDESGLSWLEMSTKLKEVKINGDVSKVIYGVTFSEELLKQYANNYSKQIGDRRIYQIGKALKDAGLGGAKADAIMLLSTYGWAQAFNMTHDEYLKQTAKLTELNKKTQEIRRKSINQIEKGLHALIGSGWVAEDIHQLVFDIMQNMTPCPYHEFIEDDIDMLCTIDDPNEHVSEIFGESNDRL